MVLGFALDADRPSVVGLPQDPEEGSEIISANTGDGSILLFGDFNMRDDVHGGFQIGRGVTHASHVIEIGEQSDIRMASGTDDSRTLTDTIDEIAFFGSELLDGHRDFSRFGEWSHEFEQGHKLGIRLFLGPAIGQLAGATAAEDDDFSSGFLHALEGDIRPIEDQRVIRVLSDAMKVWRADEPVTGKDRKR